MLNARLAEGDLFGAERLAGSTHGADLLSHVWEHATPEQLAPALASAWTISHAPLGSLSAALWTRMFKKTGYLTDPTDGAPLFTEPVTVYRGAATWTHGRGMSWTTSRERGDWFMRCWLMLEPRSLYRATVPPSAVLARFNGREEEEVVVNPHMLRSRVEVVESLPCEDPR